MNKAEENENKLAAQRYAKALIELADAEKKSKDDIMKELFEINETVKVSDDLKRVMVSPVISVTEKKTLLTKIFSASISKTAMNFLKLLVDKNRFNLLDSISKEYKSIINGLNNLLSINITSAIELTESERADICNGLSKILNKKTEIEWTVDPEIIAGLIFEANGSIIDNSVRRKIQDLGQNMIRGKVL